jgi:class 3 adenylate cyclase
MGETETRVTLKRSIAAPAQLVWALVADTNRFDRAAGLTPGKYAYRLRDEKDPRSRVLVAQAKELGFDIEWIEPPYEWAEGRFVRGERSFLAGPVTRGGFKVQLTPKGESETELDAEAWVAGSGALSWIARSVMKGKFRRALDAYMTSIESMLARTHAQLGYDWRSEPPAAAARRALLVEQTDAVTSGVRSPIREADLEFRARRFETAPVESELRARVLAFLRDRPDEELSQIRPFEVARAWQIDKRAVLRAFLFAARAGLVELQWQLNCPSCRVSAEHASSLADVKGTAHCDTCNIKFDLDFAEHVEATFRVSPAVRKVEQAVYCMSSPWFRPHVLAQALLPRGESRTFDAPLPPGTIRVRTFSGGRRAELHFDRSPKTMRVVVDDDALTIETEGEVEGEEADTVVTVESRSTGDEAVIFERTGWSADIVLGSVIASFPEFLDLFATEAPAAGVDLTVGSLVMLFTDLTGSTALYERVGDARAYAIVEEHFTQMAKAVSDHQGAIVKTMGDAVMATFTSPEDAMRCAIDMVVACESSHGDLGVHVKLGVHEGPCLAVRANDRLDYFGTTVNVAARLQAQAGSSELVVMKELLSHGKVAEIVKANGFRMREFSASLKGIAQEQALVALALGKHAKT